MKPGKYDITIKQGAKWTMTFWLKDNAGNAKDLTGYTALMHIRRSVEGAVEHEASTSGGSPEITITAGEGKVAIIFPYATTAALRFREGVWDIRLEKSSATLREVPLEGKVSVLQAVTR